MGVRLRSEGKPRFRRLLNVGIAVIALYGMVDLGLRLTGRGGETALIQQPIWIVMLIVVIALSLYDRAAATSTNTDDDNNDETAQ